MITQTIKDWLSKLFAWWPWKRSPETGYSQAVGDLNTGTIQESLWRATVDGPVPQPGITSVAVEQGRDKTFSETCRSATDDHADQTIPSSSPTIGENAIAPQPPAKEAPHEEAIPAEISVQPPPTVEQQLAFLQYLVKNGVVNEGFAEGQVPEQYRRR